MSNNIGAKDIIKDGINGFVYDTNKNIARNLAEKITLVYNSYNNLEELTQNAYETAKEVTWNNFAKKLFENLYL